MFSEGSVRRTAEREQPLRGDLPALVQAERGERGEGADAGQPRVGHLVAALQVQVAQARQRAQRAQLVACGQKEDWGLRVFRDPSLHPPLHPDNDWLGVA